MVLLKTFFTPNHTMAKWIEERFCCRLPKSASIIYEDTHGGFHGDGVLTAEVSFNSYLQNCTIAVFDTDTMKVYFLEIDS